MLHVCYLELDVILKDTHTSTFTFSGYMMRWEWMSLTWPVKCRQCWWTIQCWRSSLLICLGFHCKAEDPLSCGSHVHCCFFFLGARWICHYRVFILTQIIVKWFDTQLKFLCMIMEIKLALLPVSHPVGNPTERIPQQWEFAGELVMNGQSGVYELWMINL